MRPSDLPGTNDERTEALVAFTGILGGGVIGYFAASALRDGDLLATDPFPEGADKEIGVVGYAGGLAFTAVSVKALADEVGWAPVIWGSLGISAVALAVRAIRG